MYGIARQSAQNPMASESMCESVSIESAHSNTAGIPPSLGGQDYSNKHTGLHPLYS